MTEENDNQGVNAKQDFTGKTDKPSQAQANAGQPNERGALLIKISQANAQAGLGCPAGKPTRGRGRPKKIPLTQEEQAFVNAYLEPGTNFSAKAAVMKAGFPEKGSKDLGEKFMSDIRILRCIEMGRQKLAVAIATSREDMIRKTEAFLAIAMDKRDVVGASKILQLQIAMLGYNEPQKIDMQGSLNITFGSGEPVIIGKVHPNRFDDATDAIQGWNERETVEDISQNIEVSYEADEEYPEDDAGLPSECTSGAEQPSQAQANAQAGLGLTDGAKVDGNKEEPEATKPSTGDDEDLTLPF